MFYANIKKYDIANGVGVRVSLFVSGCTHHCKGCFNAEAWDFSYGKPYTEETEEEILDALDKDYIAGLSLLGGEPFEPQNQRALLPLLRKFRERYPQKDVWCYSGYTFDSDLQEGGRKGTLRGDGRDALHARHPRRRRIRRGFEGFEAALPRLGQPAHHRCSAHPPRGRSAAVERRAVLMRRGKKRAAQSSVKTAERAERICFRAKTPKY